MPAAEAQPAFAFLPEHPVFFSLLFLLSFNEDLFSPGNGARVAKSRDLSLVSRDQQIVTMKREGRPYSEIAEHFGISKARVSQIVSRVYEDVTDDSYREGMRLDIEGKLQVLNKLITGPGKPMVTPGGKIVCAYKDDGSGDLDYDKPLYDEFVKVDAIKTYLSALERLARQHATDRPKARDRDESQELAQAMKWVEQVAEDNKRLQKELERYQGDIVEGEIVS